jgi:hypothetical protein
MVKRPWPGLTGSSGMIQRAKQCFWDPERLLLRKDGLSCLEISLELRSRDES